MEWQDEGFVLLSRRHGEGAAILEVMTAAHGRHAGLVRGGGGRRLAPHLEPGTGLDLTWRARLEDHLGTFLVEPRRSRAGVLADRLSLAGLQSMTALLSFALPEREPAPALYAESLALLAAIEAGGFLPAYARWELQLLSELGFGLDLSACAATGTTEDLAYISPRSGAAVSRSAGAPYADKLLTLPAFFLDDRAEEAPAKESLAALEATGYFLFHRLCPALGKRALPPARQRLVDRVAAGARRGDAALR